LAEIEEAKRMSVIGQHDISGLESWSIGTIQMIQLLWPLLIEKTYSLGLYLGRTLKSESPNVKASNLYNVCSIAFLKLLTSTNFLKMRL